MTADVMNDGMPSRTTERRAAEGPPSRWRARLTEAVYRSGFYRAWLQRSVPRAIVWSPQPLRPGSAERANAMFQGRYAFAGSTVNSVAEAPWRQTESSPGWMAACHECAWLADFAAADGPTARKQARALIRRWTADFGTWSAEAWRPDTLGLRLLAWLSHADFLLVDAEPDFGDAFLSALGQQTRHLARIQRKETDVVRRTIARACLLAANISLGLRASNRERSLRRLIEDARLIADGKTTHAPEALCRVLHAVLAARSALSQTQSGTREPLNDIITSVANIVKTATHGDGALAVFQGGHESDPEIVAPLLREAGVKQAPLSVPGLARLQQGRLLAIAETAESGDQASHASALALEVSIGKQRLFVNCGAPDTDDAEWHEAARATAAHTTIVVDDRNQERDVQPSPAPSVLRGEEGDSIWMELSSNAYAQRFGIRVSRRVHMAKDGHELVCEEQVLDANGVAAGGAKPTALCARYHLHPKVTASLLGDGRQVLLKLSNGTGWMFEVDDGTASVEDSVYFGEWGRARRTKQIVINRPIVASACRLVWHLMRVDARP